MNRQSANAATTIARTCASTIIVFLALLCVVTFPALGQTASPQLLLQKALESARAITNIEIQYDDTLWIKGTPISAAESNEFAHSMKTSYPFAEDFSRTFHVTYTASGVKYRSESHNESAQSTNIIKFVQTVFDGKMWSEFNGSTGYLVEQNGDMPGDKQTPTCPLINPFLFLAKDSDDSFPCGLRFTDLRSPDVLNGLVLPNAEASNGVVRVSFAGLPRNGVNQSWSIELEAADHDFTPRTISNISAAGGDGGGEIHTVYTLSDYTNVGGFRFPAKMAFISSTVSTNKLLGPTLSCTGAVTLVSAIMPEQLPESTFQIDESKASNVWNRGEAKGFGVGVILGEEGSNIVVKNIVADSPAGRQKELQMGDRILSIVDSDLTAVPVHAGKAELARAVTMLQGAKGSAVSLTAVSAGADDGQRRAITLIRGDVRRRLATRPVLTNGMKAPDMEMVVLTNGAKERLSDYAGKIIVLEIWASWCPPCQHSMSELQFIATRYPEWKDKVVLIAASVDDAAEIASRRIEDRGWDQTHNVWLGDKDVRTYPVEGVPSAYIIDAKGMLVAAGLAGADGLKIASIVDRQLSGARSPTK